MDDNRREQLKNFISVNLLDQIRLIGQDCSKKMEKRY